MARPRIFISSTFFDLRQVRADLERFIKELGYDSVRNEMGEIPYGSEEKLEEYCYKEISEVDILVGIIGGRFGAEADQRSYSITQVEIMTAIEQDKQVYIFIDKNVYSEFQTYQLNKESKGMKYRFVDDKRVYDFIEEVWALPRNNVIHPFETALDITLFLREQWAGLFRELLRSGYRRRQFRQVSQKVEELNEVATTIKTYLENVLKKVERKEDAENLIESEDERLSKAVVLKKLRNISFVKHLIKFHHINIDQIYRIIRESNSITDIRTELQAIPNLEPKSTFKCIFNMQYINGIKLARRLMKLPAFDLSEEEQKEVDEKFAKNVIANKINLNNGA